MITGETPRINWNHKPKSDGCGSLGIKVFLPICIALEIEL